MRLENRKKTEIAFPVICAVLIVAAAHIVFMLFSGKGLLDSNPYNSYVRQAIAWSQGQLYLPENYPWLELAIYEGHYYVSFPPFPSYLLFPFALIFGEDTPESIIAFCVMLIGVFYAVRIAKHCGLDDLKSILLATFLYCANNVWMVTVDAWVWFFAQNLAFTLTLMSLYYGLTGKFGRSFFFLAAAVGCRPFQILYSLIILYWLYNEELSSAEKIKSLFLPRIHRFIPALLLGISYMVLNALRFDNPFEFGHNYLPEFLEAENGQFSITYLKDNLPRLFELPAFDPDTKKLVFSTVQRNVHLYSISDFHYPDFLPDKACLQTAETPQRMRNTGLHKHSAAPCIGMHPHFAAVRTQNYGRSALWKQVHH